MAIFIMLRTWHVTPFSKYIPNECMCKHCIFFGVIVSNTVFLISISTCSLLLYRNVILCVALPLMSDSLMTPWTIACLTLSMGFLRQEYWSGLPFPSLGAFPDWGFSRIEPSNPHLVTLLNSLISSRSVVLFCYEIP